MRFHHTDVDGVILVEPDVHGDDRGFFLETFHGPRYAGAGIDWPFVQDNQSMSTRGVLRGLHGQREQPQGKLVRCIEGAIFDVAVDARPDSPGRGDWVGFELSAENFRQLWIPPGFLHGFAVLSERAQIEYKCTEIYCPDDEYGVIWNDPDIGIEWPLDAPRLSPRDAALPRLQELG